MFDLGPGIFFYKLDNFFEKCAKKFQQCNSNNKACCRPRRPLKRPTRELPLNKKVRAKCQECHRRQLKNSLKNQTKCSGHGVTSKNPNLTPTFWLSSIHFNNPDVTTFGHFLRALVSVYTTVLDTACLLT